ncbi:MAG: Uncharacterized protein G01um101444_453 [Parcubacteria group bacterium Gr01-1014_44]|nr:MAG: Uncharacterized protein G01um101444_453 [Parcubacteria group bacterium Gr01-1014_44]
MKPLRRISTKWSTDLAYAIGLIATDGCLYRDGRHINLTSKDMDQIRTFKKCLGIKNKIGLKNSGFVKDKKYYYLQFSDVILYRFLIDVGLTPAKSKTLGSLKIPRKYFFDFLRGCFDGDGSVYAYWDKRWHSSYMYYSSFVSASLDHLKWLEKSIYKFTKAGGFINKSSGKITRAYQLKYAKSASKIIFKRMYYSDNLPLLKRKYLKFNKFLDIDLKQT